MTSAEQKLSAARLLVCRKLAPYFSHAVLALQPVEVPDGTLEEFHPEGTVAVTERGVMIWERRAIDRWTVQQLGAVLIHEVMHMLQRHAHRRGGRENIDWVCAADREINDDCRAMSLDLPDKPLFPEQINMDEGLSAEAYYEAACRPPQKGQGKSKGGGGAGKSGKGNPGDGSGKARPSCGGVGGCPSKAEAKYGGQAQGKSEAQMDAIRRQTADAVRDHVKNRGTVPAGVARWADVEGAPPKVPWEQKLARCVRNAIAWRPGAVDLRYLKPSRRQAGIGYGAGRPVLPALISPVPEVAFVLDTSGSMSPSDLRHGLDEAVGILKAVGARITFIANDAEVHSFKKIANAGEMAALVKGGGGTTFSPALKALSQSRNPPEVCIFATDGFGEPDVWKPPNMRVIWLLCASHSQKPADFGDIIDMEVGTKRG